MQTLEEITGKTGSKEYFVIRLNKDNLRDVAMLHSEVYGVPPAEDFFYKKFDTAYTGVENVGFIAYNKDHHPVAYYGVLPCFIKYGNQIILAAQSADTMTHPQHRYKGMFVELSNMTFDLCKQLGIWLVFGFPNQNSYHGAVNKLGWKMTEKMVCFSIPVRKFLLILVFRKMKAFRKIYKRYQQFILSKYLTPLAGVANSVISDGYAGIDRSDEYFSYKKYSSSYVIAIDGSKIWVSKKNDALIGDIENINEVNFNIVMNKLKKIAGRLGIKEMQFHCSPGTMLHKLFAEKFKPVPSYPMLFQDFGSSILPEKIKFTFADIDIF